MADSADIERATPARARGRSAVLPRLYAVFFLSGLSALGYQTAWQRMLGLFGGSDTVAATIVVGAFLLGLGLGSLLGASFADRLSDRGAIRAFALCELGIGGFALASRFIFYDVLFGELIALARSPGLVLWFVFLALLPPTMLMGMSLPLLTRAVVDRIETAPAKIGWLYGVNTLGAAVGALLAGAYVIGTFGYEVAVYLGALVNLLVGLAALQATTLVRGGLLHPRGRPVSAPFGRVPPRIWVWSGIVFVSGFLIISLEIVWFRVLGVLMQSNAYAFSLVLAVFLAADALGIVGGAWLIRRVADPRRFFQWQQGVAALYALGSMIVIYLAHAWLDLPRWFTDAPAYAFAPGWRSIVRLAMYFAVTAFAVFPPAFLLGMSFPTTQKAVQDDPTLVGQRVGLIQFFNILGNTTGAVVTGLLLLQWIGTAGTLRLIGLIGLAFVAALWGGRSRQRQPAPSWRRHMCLGLALPLVLGVVAFPTNAALWSRLHGTAARGAVVGEDRTGVAVLRPNGGARRLFIGGHAQSAVPFMTVHGALGVLGALVHPNPRSVLVIGHGTGGTPYAAAINPATERIRVIEIVEPVLSVIRRYARESGDATLSAMFTDPRFERVVADGRHALFTDERRYDLIEADAILPQSSHSGLLYSIEFFRQVRARLNDGGIYVQWAPTPRTVATFRSVFPHVVQVNAALLGSNQPIPFVRDALATRLRGSARSYVVAGGWDPEALLTWLSAAPPEELARREPGAELDVNSDLFPKDEYFLNRRKITVFGINAAPPR